jgi:FkbM family methyltransferase
MNRRLRDFTRWHIEKHLLGALLRPDADAGRAEPVADALLPAGVITPQWRCYCAGVGEDIRFERHLAERLGAQVWSFDPTPRSIDFMSRSDHDRAKLHFLPMGLWKEDVTLRFHAPANPNHVSHSVMEEQGGSAHFDAVCRSVPSVMREHGHDAIDLLKMNIEGAEHVVLDHVLAAGLRPRVITLTWEGDDAFRKAIRWTKRLRAEGYRFLGRRAWFFTYVARA